MSNRNLSSDGYNLGLRYQCVEFVKRYYYQRFGHKMPDAYGHAKDFFNKKLNDGQLNQQRDLIQYKNPSSSEPHISDLLIFDEIATNAYGHVAIIAQVQQDSIEIIQQNPGPFGQPRAKYKLSRQNHQFKIENERVLGWLRQKS